MGTENSKNIALRSNKMKYSLSRILIHFIIQNWDYVTNWELLTKWSSATTMEETAQCRVNWIQINTNFKISNSHINSTETLRRSFCIRDYQRSWSKSTFRSLQSCKLLNASPVFFPYIYDTQVLIKHLVLLITAINAVGFILGNTINHTSWLE